jgi:hypothetical protein
VPLGWDSPGYAWRTRLARSVGAGALPSNLPYPGPFNPGRPAFPVVGGIVASLSGTDPLRVTEVIPAVMAAATALAWGAMVRIILGWTGWRAVSVALFVGMSPFVVHAIGIEGYQDAAMALAVWSAAVLCVLLAVRDGRAVGPAVVLVGAAGTIHWSFVPVTLAILCLTALAFLPTAVRARRGGRRATVRTPTVRLLAIGVAGAAIAALWIVVLLPSGLPHARLEVAQLLDKFRRDLPQLGLWFVLPLAAIGAVSLAGEDRSERDPGSADDEGALRRTAFLWLTLAWCEVALLAVAAVYVLRWAIPGHRVLAFCVALPALAAVGLVWLGERAAAVLRRSAAVAGAVVVAGLVLSAAWAQRAWLTYHPVMRAATVAEAMSASSSLERARIPDDRPVIFVLDDHGAYAWSRTWIAAHTIRAELAPSRLTHAYFYVGTPENMLSGRSTTQPPTGSPLSAGIDPATYEALSSTYFAAVQPVLSHSPVILMLASTNPSFPEWTHKNPANLVAPGVAVLQGASPSSLTGNVQRRAPSVAAPSPIALIGLALLAAAIVSLVGAGWTVTLLGRWFDAWAAAALAPAVGTGILVLGAVALGRLGVRPNVPGSVAIVAILTLAGLVGPVRARARARVERARSG